MKNTIRNLIANGILVRADFSETLSDTGFVSYTVADNKLMMVKVQAVGTDAIVTYVQLIDSDYEAGTPITWVFQLAGYPDEPNNYSTDSSYELEYRLFSEV